ncbi:hypothetical protein N2152v2_000179 [Parachlorella kessleri]
MDGDTYCVEERRHSKGFVSALFRKKQRPENSVFEAQSDFDVQHPGLDSPGVLAQRQPSKSKWGLLSRRNSGSRQAANVAELQKDVEFFRGECLKQGQELQELQYRLEGQDARGRELQQRLNLERFKYELLVDLWAMRVLDNEELGKGE